MNIMMNALSLIYFISDLPDKIKFKCLRKFKGLSIFTTTTRSDSDSTQYSDFVRNTSSHSELFFKFRKDYSYRVILEHVDYKLGANYLGRLDQDYLSQFAQKPFFEKMSQIGSPRVFYYSGIGWVSPTLIRYLFVNQSILELFDARYISSMCEIGVGFGGQCAVSSESLRLQTYALYDLPAVLDLTDRFLTELRIDKSIYSRRDINQLIPERFDLVISNYAFSELPRETQLDYVDKILTRSSRGYLTMNSGRTNYSGRSTGKMALDDLLDRIPGAEVLEEDPLTGPDNYILVWGHNRLSK